MRCFEHASREALGSCVSCGKGVCLDCLTKSQGRIYCFQCQPTNHTNLNIQINHQAQSLTRALSHNLNRNQSMVVMSEKNRYIASLLALFVGTFGVHKFYLNQPFWGVMYILFCWTGIPSLAAFIEGVMYLVRSEEDFIRRYGHALNAAPQNHAVLLNSKQPKRPVTPKDYERFLLQFAHRHQGQISMALLMADYDLPMEKIEDSLAHLIGKGLVESHIDDQGHVRYIVSEFRQLNE